MHNNIKELLKTLKIDKPEIAELLDVSVPSVYRIINNPEQHADRIDKIQSYIDEIQGNDPTPHTAHNDKEDEDTLSFDGKTLKAHCIINSNPANMKLDEIRDSFELDEEKWECTGYKVKSWNTSMKNKEKEAMVIKNYSVMANFKPINGWMVTIEDIEWIKEILSQSSERVKLSVQPNYDGGVMVLPLYDAHFGKYAWAEETNDPYNLDIARDRYLTAATCLLARAKEQGVQKVILPIGQDLLNVDNKGKTTTAGTPQDSAGQTKEIYATALETMQDILTLCADSGMEVEAFYNPGNHDTILSYTLVKALAGWFHNDERVKITDNATSRYYIHIGKNLLGFSHGNNEKGRLFDLMQSEAREMWGLSEYSEWIVGHTHDEKVEKKSATTKRTIGSLSGADLWTYDNGYTSSLPIMQAPIYRNDIAGPYSILYHNARQHDPVVANKTLVK